jgi:hypothetical protein
MFKSNLPGELLAIRLKTKALTEKWHHMILEAICDSTRVSAVIDFEPVCNSVLVQNVVELVGVGP